MSIINPFPPHGDPDPADVVLFFWLPVFLCIGLPLLALLFGALSNLLGN